MSNVKKQHVYVVLTFDEEPVVNAVYATRKLAELKKEKLKKTTDKYVAVLRKGVNKAPRHVLL